MKIAIISDIHGNFDALVEVLQGVKKEGIEHLIILGDIVGYYYHPDKIMDELSKWNCYIIKGNHEYILEKLIANPSIGESIRLKYGSGHQEAKKKLTSRQLGFLKNLPDTNSIQFNGVSIMMSHGSPWSNDYYIYPDCSRETLRKCDLKEYDFVLIGHSHYAFAVHNNSSILINPGSVGQSRQIGGKADWCIINTANKCFQFISTDYNVQNLLKEVSEKDPDVKYLTSILKRK